LPDGEKGEVFVWESGKDGSIFFGSTRQIGVGVSSLTKQLGDYFGVADGKGLLINSVNENSSAAKAGLKAGDVIVEVEGKAVGNIADLIRGLNEKKEGEVSLTVVRNRNRQTVKVTPEKMKEGEVPVRVMAQPGGRIRVNAAPKVRISN
jgi:C-terminal processing protease CtpA/Prc